MTEIVLSSTEMGNEIFEFAMQMDGSPKGIFCTPFFNPEDNVLDKITNRFKCSVENLLLNLSYRKMNILHLASQNPNNSTFVINIIKNVDKKYLDIGNEEGKTALYFAIEMFHIFKFEDNFSPIVRILLESGANPNIFFQNETSILWKSWVSQNFELMKFLLKYEAHLSPIEKNRLTPELNPTLFQMIEKAQAEIDFERDEPERISYLESEMFFQSSIVSAALEIRGFSSLMIEV